MPGMGAAAFSKTAAVLAQYGSGSQIFTLATGSPGELGLVRALGEAFCSTHDAALRWRKAGTGESLALLKAGQVDMVMVHAPAEAERAVTAGWASGMALIGCNAFYIVGPRNDPAAIASTPDAAEAYRRIAAARTPFVSRGDNSGTHQKEMQLWARLGIRPDAVVDAEAWYIVNRDFMSACLARANALGAYFMTDSSTWLVEGQAAPALQILLRDDPALLNVYHALLARPGATPQQRMAQRFADFVAGPEGQRIIATYGVAEFGAPLYRDADYARRFV